MTAVFVDLIVMLVWPIVLSTAAWMIAIHALAERDEISEVVKALTQPNRIQEKLEQEVKAPLQSHGRAISRKENAGFWDHFKASQHVVPKLQNGEMPSDEKPTFA